VEGNGLLHLEVIFKNLPQSTGKSHETSTGHIFELRASKITEQECYQLLELQRLYSDDNHE